MVEQDAALHMFLDCLTTLTNVTSVRVEAAEIVQNGVRYQLTWQTGKGYVAEKVQPVTIRWVQAVQP